MQESGSFKNSCKGSFPEDVSLRRECDLFGGLHSLLCAILTFLKREWCDHDGKLPLRCSEQKVMKKKHYCKLMNQQ